MAIMLRDSRTASHNFRLSSQSWDGTPKPKFLYYVRFLRASNSRAGDSGADWAKGIGILAKNIDRPKIQFETETLNQYNKKRVIQKRVEYEPMSFSFHDTVDNKVLHMFEDYFRFYYGDPRNTSATDWSWDVVAENMNQGQAGAWGFIPPGDGTNNSHFFSHIELYFVYGGRYSRYDIINPKIKSFMPSNMEYSSSDGAEVQMVFEYEGVVYQGNNFSLGSQAGLIAEMGLASSGFYEPRTNSGTAIIGSGAYYSRQGAEPYYMGADLLNSAFASQTSSISGSSRSSVIIDSNMAFNSVFTGYATRTESSSTSQVFTGPTQGDNIARRMVQGLK